MPGPDSVELYRDRARRGARSAKARVSVHMVDGESVTFVQMAARLGCTRDAAKNRFDHAKRNPGPITWASLSR